MTRRILGKILLVVVVVLGLLGISGILQAAGSNGASFERVKAVRQAHSNRLEAIKGVVGTAVGLDKSEGHVVMVLLEKPDVPGIAKKLDGVSVKKVVTGKIVALVDPTARFLRPVPTGVSTGHPNITAGTIGCRVTDGSNVYALSNNHVYADENNASIGDNVLQPGPYDGGANPGDKIGTLYDFEPIEFKRKARNKLDAAIALTSTGDLGTATPSDGYGTPNSEIVTAVLGQAVQKYGRTTGLTKGQIKGLNATVKIEYGPGRVAKFVDQIIIEPGAFSAGGDSGSLIVTDDENLNPVGLLFAGSSSHTIANRIDLVLARFNVTVDGQTPTANDAPVVSITSPADDDVFASGASISFAGTATDTEDGDITTDIVWTSDKESGSIGTGGSFSATLSDGVHNITAAVADSGAKVGSAAISIIVGTPPVGPTTVSVSSITYAGEGGKNRDKHLKITASLVDNLGDPVAGASVSIALYRNGSSIGSATGTTGSTGNALFTLKNAASGIYTSNVTNVSASGLTWDGVTPTNTHTK